MAAPTPIESAKQANELPYPSSPAVGVLKFTATAGPGEARVLDLLPPVRAGHGKRMRLHVATALKPGERLRELDLQAEGAATLGLGTSVRVVSVKPLVAERPKSKRGNRIRRAVRRWDAQRQKAAAKGADAPAEPKDKRRNAKTRHSSKHAGKPESRGKRTPAGWSVLVEL